MKKTNNTILGIIVLLLIISCNISNSEGIEYEWSKEYNGWIIVSVDLKSDTFKVPLKTINQRDDVVGIGPGVFENNKALKRIELTENIKYIGKNAFKDSGLEYDVELPNVERIETNAFKNVKVKRYYISPELISADKHIIYPDDVVKNVVKVYVDGLDNGNKIPIGDQYKWHGKWYGNIPDLDDVIFNNIGESSSLILMDDIIVNQNESGITTFNISEEVELSSNGDPKTELKYEITAINPLLVGIEITPDTDELKILNTYNGNKEEDIEVRISLKTNPSKYIKRTITVKRPVIKSIDIIEHISSAEGLTVVNKGSIKDYDYTYEPENAYKEDIKFTSSNSSLATIDENTGELNALAEGNVDISVGNTNLLKTITVEIKDISPIIGSIIIEKEDKTRSSVQVFPKERIRIKYNGSETNIGFKYILSHEDGTLDEFGEGSPNEYSILPADVNPVEKEAYIQLTPRRGQYKIMVKAYKNYRESDVSTNLYKFYQSYNPRRCDINNSDKNDPNNIDNYYYDKNEINEEVVNQINSGIGVEGDYNYIGLAQSLTDLLETFRDFDTFNGDISEWDVSNIKNMGYMFNGALSFNCDLSKWDVSNVTNMARMFYDAQVFNQPLNNWYVNNVTDMEYMFYNAQVFNQPLNKWNISNVTSIRFMFARATSFNQPLNDWDVSNIIYPYHMFEGATSFNQPLNKWDTSRFLFTNNMFYGASSFDQDLSSWDVSNVVQHFNVFKGSAMEGKKAKYPDSTWAP